MNWMQRIRLRVLALLVAVALVVIGTVSFAALPLWPVLGVAVAATVFVVSTITSRLSHPTCWSCGADLSGSPAGAYGAACARCGAISQHLAVRGPAGPGATVDRDSRAGSGGQA